MTTGKSVRPTHMLLQDRMAYALRAAYLRSAPIGQDEPSRVQDQLEKLIGGIAAEVAEEGTNDPPDSFLANAVIRAERATQAMVGAAFREIEQTVVAVQARIAQIRCSACHFGRVCDGGDYDDGIVDAGGECIAEIKAAFAGAVTLARREYGNLPNVEVVLCTTGLSRCPGLVPGMNLAINGRTRFEDTRSGRASIVTLELASALMDGQSLDALPYVMLHEVLCHAFQMSAGRSTRSNETRFTDPVSEGMIDKLAVKLLQDEATRLTQARPSASAEADIALRIHLARKAVKEKPQFPQAPQVSLGVLVWDSIHHLYAKDSDAFEAERDAKQLAFALNLHGWSYDERFKGLSRLAKMLHATPRDVKLIGLLLRYRDTPDVDDLIRYLVN